MFVPPVLFYIFFSRYLLLLLLLLSTVRSDRHEKKKLNNASVRLNSLVIQIRSFRFKWKTCIEKHENETIIVRMILNFTQRTMFLLCSQCLLSSSLLLHCQMMSCHL